jgi:hypothetical protein
MMKTHRYVTIHGQSSLPLRCSKRIRFRRVECFKRVVKENSMVKVERNAVDGAGSGSRPQHALSAVAGANFCTLPSVC